MLLSFSVENHRSIRDRQTLSFQATPSTERDWSNIQKIGSARVLKGAALYGANASGKSNIIDALHWFVSQVLLSPSESLEDSRIPVEPYRLRATSQAAPCVFEVELFVDDDLFRYGFAATEDRIVEEWLYRRRASSNREARLFTRDEQVIDVNSSQLKGAKALVNQNRTRKDVLFLRACATWNVDLAEQVLGRFRRVRFASGLSEKGFFGFTASKLSDRTYAEDLLRFAQKADFGICGLRGKLVPIAPDDFPNVTTPEIKTDHTVFDAKGKAVGTTEFDLSEDESQGSQKFIALAGPILHTLQEGSILVVDELEARLHPTLTKALVDYFFGPHNKKGAQLIFATHDVGLMVPELLRRDQIWFTEKDEQGATGLYSLDEFKKDQVRPTSRFDKQYLQGLFGAIPKVALEDF